jgi:hypothetical protein
MTPAFSLLDSQAAVIYLETYVHFRSGIIHPADEFADSFLKC